MPISINNTTLTFNNGTTMTTAATGTVSSVATGNGLQGGTITTTGTLSIACPSFNTVGSYTFGGGYFNQGFSGGATFSAGPNTNQVQGCYMRAGNSNCLIYWYVEATNNLSGTWRVMTSIANGTGQYPSATVFCRVS